jgi:hypothetical protein
MLGVGDEGGGGGGRGWGGKGWDGSTQEPIEPQPHGNKMKKAKGWQCHPVVGVAGDAAECSRGTDKGEETRLRQRGGRWEGRRT